STFLPALLASSILGHGQVRHFITSTTTYRAADAYASLPDPNSPIRKLDTYGPAAPFTDATITCGSGGNNPAAVVAPVAAGSSVTFDWGAWTSDYIAACPDGCANVKGDTGNVWVKIQQDGYVPNRTPAWAEKIIEAGGASVAVCTLPNGEYLLRHEILGLIPKVHGMGSFSLGCYRNCVQISITGGGNLPLPSGVALPGAYQPTDPGIYLWLYTITPTNSTYIIPGGPVLYGSTSKASSTSSSTVSSTTKASSTSISSTSSKASSSSSASSSSTTEVAKYAQCGGINFTGSTICVAGTTCTVLNPYYSEFITFLYSRF
ncbi:carbohydrate-binding module family 1 protein, partial [Serendipita vermifera MAFF 305830]